jgi:hypothetical protein
MKKSIFGFFVVLALLLTAGSAHAQFRAIPIGVSFSSELQDANASILGNVFIEGAAFTALHVDGRDEFLTTSPGTHVELEVAVNAPRAIDQRTGRPKYRVAFQLGDSEPEHATYVGGNRWRIRVDGRQLRPGIHHLVIGLDGLVVGRSRPNLDLVFIRVPLPGRDVREDRGIIAKLVVLDYRGSVGADALTEFLMRRIPEYSLTRRVNWSDRLDAGAATQPQQGTRQADPVSDLGHPSQAQAVVQPEPFEFYSDPAQLSFVVKNNLDRDLVLVIEGEGIERVEPRIVRPGRTITINLREIQNREFVVFALHELGRTSTGALAPGRLLARQRYSEEG